MTIGADYFASFGVTVLLTIRMSPAGSLTLALRAIVSLCSRLRIRRSAFGSLILTVVFARAPTAKALALSLEVEAFPDF